MILLDSNIIIHGINNASPHHQLATRFIQNNRQNICISHQNYLETLRVITHKTFQQQSKQLIARESLEKISQNIQTIYPLQNSLIKAKAFIKAHHISGNKIFDAYLVATMLSNQITTIATDNTKDFNIYKEIKVINPFTKPIPH